MSLNRTMTYGPLPSGDVGLVYQDTGEPVPPEQPMATTAGEVNGLLMHWITLAIEVGHQAGARAVAGPQYEAGVKAGAEAVAGPAMRSGAEAGVKAGAAWVMQNSVVRRRVERDERGQVTGTIEERVP